jgi:Cu(I)/Ag(I) efflux system membrane fusion protein
VKPSILLGAAAAILAAAAASFMLHPDLLRTTGVKLTRMIPPAVAEGAGTIIYYQDPDGRPSYSLTPRKTPDGRDYRAVPASADVSFDQPATTETVTAPPDRKIKYYRNPMGLPDTSPTPKKDTMGMDYIPVYEGDDSDDGSVKLSPGKIQRTGVRSEPAPGG